MSLQARAAGKDESKPSSTDLIASIRDLIVHLHRGNGAKAETIVTEVATYLREVMSSGDDPGSPDMQRAQQTMFAIDEVRTLMAQSEFEDAATAARDAAKEWKQKPRPSLD